MHAKFPHDAVRRILLCLFVAMPIATALADKSGERLFTLKCDGTLTHYDRDNPKAYKTTTVTNYYTLAIHGDQGRYYDWGAPEPLRMWYEIADISREMYVLSRPKYDRSIWINRITGEWNDTSTLQDSEKSLMMQDSTQGKCTQVALRLPPKRVRWIYVGRVPHPAF